MIAFPIGASRACAAAAMAAGLFAAMNLVPSNAAEKAPTGAEAMHEEFAQSIEKHVQARLDELAARLEIKASQEPAWQAFAAALRDLVTAEFAQRAAAASRGNTDLDAASLARRHADWAAERAQKLARLAEATAKLQQTLSADQRLVLNEVARRFAQARWMHAPMHGRAYEPHHPHEEGIDEGCGPGEHHPGPHGDAMGRGAP